MHVPWTQGALAHPSTMAVSQRAPVKPIGHEQLAVPEASLHVPPFIHGLGLQGLEPGTHALPSGT